MVYVSPFVPLRPRGNDGHLDPQPEPLDTRALCNLIVDMGIPFDVGATTGEPSIFPKPRSAEECVEKAGFNLYFLKACGAKPL